jgi:hypothetical protein
MASCCFFVKALAETTEEWPLVCLHFRHVSGYPKSIFVGVENANALLMRRAFMFRSAGLVCGDYQLEQLDVDKVHQDCAKSATRRRCRSILEVCLHKRIHVLSIVDRVASRFRAA